MTRNQFLALWSLKTLNDQAFQKYKDMGYERRVRELPDLSREDYAMVYDEHTWQNLIDKNNWYEQWQSRVEHHLTSFKEDSTKYLLAFQNLDFEDWADTSANKLELQMEVVTRVLKLQLKKHGLYTIHKSHYDSASKVLYLLQLRNRMGWKVKDINFSRTSRPAQILERIFSAPLEHHDYEDIRFYIGDKNQSNLNDSNRSLYFALKNINKKIDKDLGFKAEFLNIENNQVWIDQLHI